MNGTEEWIQALESQTRSVSVSEVVARVQNVET